MPHGPAGKGQEGEKLKRRPGGALGNVQGQGFICSVQPSYEHGC